MRRETQAASVIKVRVRRAVEDALRAGHPWVFDRAITTQHGQGPPGTLATIYDHRNKFLAVGLYDPDAPIRVRVLQIREPASIDAAWFAGRLRQASRLRAGLESEGTTGFRIAHGENDGLPALVLDRYGDVLVLKVYTAAWFPHLNAIVEAIEGEWPDSQLVLRLSRNVPPTADVRDGLALRGELTHNPVTFSENSLRFEADVLRGQKTGFFLDQRENRQRVRTLAAGRRVLNLFSYTGGFSVYAAAGGASHVTSVDLSRHALDGVARNFALNAVLATHDEIQGDAFEVLSKMKKRFGLVIVDPPSFAMRESARRKAIEAYRSLNGLAAAVVEDGGILVTCSCSAHVSPEEFGDAVERAPRPRAYRILERTGHPVDHPVGFKEGRYLKALFVRIG